MSLETNRCHGRFWPRLDRRTSHRCDWTGTLWCPRRSEPPSPSSEDTVQQQHSETDMTVHVRNETVKESHFAFVELFLLVLLFLLIVFAQVQVSPLVEIMAQQLFESLAPAFLQIIHTQTAVTVRNAAHKHNTYTQYRWCDFMMTVKELRHGECVGLTCGRLWSRFWAGTAVSSPVPSLGRAERHKLRPARPLSGLHMSGNRRTTLRTPRGRHSVLCLHMNLTRWRDRI